MSRRNTQVKGGMSGYPSTKKYVAFNDCLRHLSDNTRVAIVKAMDETYYKDGQWLLK